MEPRPDTSSRPPASATGGGPAAPRGIAPAFSPLSPPDDRSTPDWRSTADPAADERPGGGASGDGSWRQRGPSVPRAGQASEPPGSMLANDHPYSPGPALSPLDGSRSGRWVGPLLALVALAVVIGAVVFAFNRARSGNDQRDGTLANQNATGTVIAAGAAGATAAATKAAGESPTAAPTKGAAEAAQASGANPTANPARTPDAQAPTAAGAANPTATKASSANRTRALLPAASALPAGFVQTEKDKRTKDQVAGSFADPADATTKLDGWGWKENQYIAFEIPAAGNPVPTTTNVINVSVHRFSDKQGAAEALTYFADAVVQAQDLAETTIDPIGEQSRALKGAPDGSNLVVLYIRDGNYLIRIGGSSPQGDPTTDVVAVAKKVVG
ncbi:MAG: hypothetical protein ACR2OO_13035 [Thermomicrobiales bacterium]